jgi:arginine decarboxylase-like protein
VEEILEFGQFHRMGLEAGSKPELLITLAHMDTPNALIICNGFEGSRVHRNGADLAKARPQYVYCDRSL